MLPCKKSLMIALPTTLCLIYLLALATPAKADDTKDLVGRWDHPTTDEWYIRFNADGTFKEASFLGTYDGTYRFLSKEVIELTFTKVLFAKRVIEVKYRLTGDTFEMKLKDNWVKYSRVK
jgi:hypothetical protein